MNNKLLIIFKAIEKLPNDIKYLIVKEVKYQEGTFISETLRKIYYRKVCKNTEIFKLLCVHSIYFSNFFEEDVIIFLLYTKNNLTFSYIIDTFLWMDKFIAIHNYYRNKSNYITQLCAFILEKIILKKIEY